MSELLIYGTITVFLTLTIFFLLHMLLKRKKDKRYLEALDEYYGTVGVYQSLCIARNEFSTSSIEYIAIDRGLFYLDHSILMDYQTCFNIIENVFRSKIIRQMHKSILAEEKAKCLMLLEKSEQEEK